MDKNEGDTITETHNNNLPKMVYEIADFLKPYFGVEPYELLGRILSDGAKARKEGIGLCKATISYIQKHEYHQDHKPVDVDILYAGLEEVLQSLCYNKADETELERAIRPQYRQFHRLGGDELSRGGCVEEV